MSTSNSLRRAVRYALLTSAAATVAAALPAQGQEPTPIQEVVVTGSRIPQPGLTSISPVTAVTSETVKIEGVTRVEDMINNMPQAFADFGGNLSNGATGAATVNLRGLDCQRTLVLANARRLMPGDPTQNGDACADLNQIPAALIERVEVLTGGASAVYGADAVAGVVNFILNDDFEGVRVDAQYSFYQHDNDNNVAQVVRDAGFALPDSNVRDGYTRDITFILGMNAEDGRGNATIYAGYRELDPLLQSERDYSACALGSGDVFECSGSSTGDPPRLQAIDNDPTSETFSAETGPSRTYDPATGALVPFTTLYNFAPLNYYQRPDERYTAGLFAHYDVSEGMQAYAEFAFMKDRTLAQIAGSGLFRFSGLGAGGAYTVNCDNPFLTAELVDLFCTSQGLSGSQDALVSIGKRNVEGGGRVSDLEHTSYRAVIGARGDFAEGWGYDVYGLYGQTDYAQTYLNDFSLRRAANALTVVNDPDPASDTFGQPICRINADTNPANDDAACVPYNVFQPGGITDEALEYIQTPGFSNGRTIEQILSASVTGDLGQYGVRLPTAQDGLGVALGAEYRSEELELRNDAAFLSGDLAGQGGATLDTAGSFDVKELFAEARLPILQDKPFAQTMSLEAGYRYSDYSLGFDTDTYKIGAEWGPIEDIRFRASFQRAVRAPNIQELFRPNVVQLDGNTDPCAVDEPGVQTPERSLEECLRTGITPGQYGNIAANPAAQYNGLTGGLATLDPESSDTYAFGFVFTPRFLEDFSLTIDYFDIKVEDLIGALGADLILRNCLDTGDPQWCTLINRAPGSGSLWTPQGYVIDTNTNTGFLQTKGLDVEANYRLQLGERGGGLAFQLIGTYVDEFVTEPVTGEPTYDCVGFYGVVCGVPAPEFRTKFRTTWNSPWNLDLTLTWRHIDEVALDSSSTNPQLASEIFLTDAKLDAQDYFDLTASYALEFEPASLTFRLGVNNFTDEDPPLVGQSTCTSVLCSGNTFPQVYDTLGRLIFMNITADF